MDNKANLITLVLVSVFLAACTATSKPPVALPEFAPDFQCEDSDFDFNRSGKEHLHIVRFDKHGLVASPHRGEASSFASEPLSRDEVEQHYQRIFCEAERLAKSKSPDEAESDTVKILVYIHGGLNSLSSSDRRFDSAGKTILNEKTEWHYPVYVSWPSGAPSTIAEHAVSIREGRPANFYIGLLTSPLIVGADILQSVGNLPSTLYYQITTEKDRVATKSPFTRGLSNAWKESAKRFCNQQAPVARLPTAGMCDGAQDYKVQANLSMYYYGSAQQITQGSASTLTIPVRYSIGALYHSALATSGWDVMKRRARNVFYPPQLFDGRNVAGVAGGSFFDLLRQRAEYHLARGNELDYEVTLVGHSMGAIVINNALERNQARWVDSGAIRNVVYMGGAATIADTLNSVEPLLTRATAAKSPINFYNLMLNRVAEISEDNAVGLIPLGSLLVSIDQHYERPEHPLDRTIGSEVNVHTSIGILNDALQYSDGAVVFKSFDRCAGAKPYKHTHFGDLAYWRADTWRSATSGCEHREPLVYKK